jgi:chemotaxis protein methyltransferase CheR
VGTLDQSQDVAADDRRGGAQEFPLHDDEYRYLTAIVYERSGIVLGANKVNMVYSRLVRRLRELKLKSFHDYCALLESDQGNKEIGFLINAITTNLTRFFRENHHFEHLRGEVLATAKTKNRIRIWSAGCSSGEEPYSIAMTLAEAFPDIGRMDARILATDLDTTMVATGHAGIYPEAAVSDLPGAARAKFFRRVTDDGEKAWEVIDPVKRLIAFKHLNLLGTWPMKGPFDAIFCRNVMIYFDGPTKAALVERYARMLKPEGWLYIGHSESLLDNSSGFRLAGRTIYRKAPA